MKSYYNMKKILKQSLLMCDSEIEGCILTSIDGVQIQRTSVLINAVNIYCKQNKKPHKKQQMSQ